MEHRTLADLELGLDHVRDAPHHDGTLQLIVRRPQPLQRELLDAGDLDVGLGLVGDSWSTRGTPNPDAQLTLMNARAAALVCGSEDHDDWAQAGDQLYVDFDLGAARLPPGTRLAIGGAIVEVTAEPHLGCGKFAQRFGVDALKLVNRDDGRALRLRGVNARVIVPGTVRRGDPVRIAD